MILGDKPARQYFVLRDFSFDCAFPNKSELCNWMHAAGKVFAKTCLKTIRGTFFCNMRYFFPNMWYCYLIERESLNF